MLTSTNAAGKAEARKAIVRRGLRLEYLTVSWNVLEAVVALVAGLIAGSIALVGFGLDSVIEVSSGAVLLWRLHSDVNEASRERVERISVRLVGISLLALATYVAVDAAKGLWGHERPEESIAGIVIAALSLLVMPIVARAKRRVAAEMSSGAMHADSKQTDICAYLSAILLGGLILNAIAGWWWADSVAALVMVPLIAREGLEAVQGKTCACHSVGTSAKADCCGGDADECHE